MLIRSVSHRGLRRLLEENSSQFLQPELVTRIRNVLTALLVSEDMNSFVEGTPPGWRVHRLSGTRQAEWSVAVSGNWRITFEEAGGFIDSLNLEDYH